MVEHSQKTGKTDNDAADIIRRVGFRFRAHDALEELKEQLEIIDLRNDSEYIKNLMEALNSFSMFTRNFSSNISVKKSTILLTNDVLLRLWSLFNDIDKDRDLKELYGEKQTNRMIRLISDESYQIIRSSFPQFMFLMKGSKNGICRRILQLLNFIKDFSLRNYEEISKYLHRIDLNIFKELLTKVNFNETKDCRYETIIFLLSFMKNELLEKNEIFRMIIVEDLWYRSQFDKLETIHLILENLMKRLPNSLPFFYADQKLFKKFLSKILQLICWRGPVKFQQMQNLNIKKISLISHILYNYNKISENFCLENNPEIDGRTRIIERNTILKLIEQSIFSIIHQTNNEHRFDVLIWLIEEGLPPVMWKKIDENLFVFYNEIIKSILIKVNLVNVELSCKVLKGLYKREYENEWLNLLGELYSSKSFQIIDDGHLDIGLIVRKNYLYQMKISPQLIQIIGKYLRDRYLTPILSSHTNPLRQWKHLDWLIKEFDVNQMDFPIILQIIFDYSINYKTESEVNVKMKNHLDFIIQYIEDDEKLTRLDSISICQIIILLKKFDSITLHCLHEKFSHFIIDRSRKKENYDNIIFINLFNFLINEKLDNNLHFNPYSMTNDDEMVKYFIFFSFSFFYKKKELEMEYKMRIIEQLWVVVMSPFNIKSNLIKQMEKYLLTGTWNVRIGNFHNILSKIKVKNFEEFQSINKISTLLSSHNPILDDIITAQLIKYFQLFFQNTKKLQNDLSFHLIYFFQFFPIYRLCQLHENLIEYIPVLMKIIQKTLSNDDNDKILNKSLKHKLRLIVIEQLENVMTTRLTNSDSYEKFLNVISDDFGNVYEKIALKFLNEKRIPIIDFIRSERNLNFIFSNIDHYQSLILDFMQIEGNEEILKEKLLSIELDKEKLFISFIPKFRMIYQHPTNLFFHQLLKITPQSFLNFYKYHSNSTFFFGDLLLLNHLSPEQQSMTTSNILRAINLFVKLNQIELGVNLMKSFLRKSQKFQNENEFTTFLDLFVKLNEKLDEDAQRPLMKQIRKNKELWELSINRFDETYLKFFRKIPKAIQRDLMDNFQTNNIFWRLITSDLQSLLTIIYENHHELQERHWRTIKESFSDMSEEFLKNEQELLEMLKEFVKFSFSQIYRSNGISIEVLREILERIHPNWKTFNFVELSITIQSLIWHVPLLEENEYIFMKNVSIEKYINIMNYKLKYHNYINVNSAFVSMFLRDIQNRIMRDIEFQSIISTKKKSGKKLIADEKGEIEKNFNLKTIQIEMVKLIYLLYEKNGFEECSHDNELKDDSSKKRKVINDDETNTSDGNDWINLREFYLPSLKENVKYKSINTFDKYYEPFFRIIYTGTTNQPDLYLYELLRKFEKRISIEENEQIFYLWDKTARNYFQYQIDVRLNSKMEREKFERILMDGKIYLNKRIDIDYSYEQQIFSASELFGQFKKKFLLESAIQFESVKFEKTIQSFDNKQNFIIYDPRFVLPIFSRLLNGDLSIDPLKILVGNQILTYLISMSQCRITRIRMCSLYNLNICDIYHMRTGKFEFKNDVYFLMDMFRFGATFNHYQIVRNKKNKMIPLDRKQFPAKLFWIDKWLILAIGHFFRIIASYSSDTDEQPTNVHQILNRCFVNQSTTMISSFGLFSQFIHSLPSLNSNEDVRIFFIECFLLSPNLSESYIKLLQRRLSLINVLLIILYESMNKKSKIKELILKFFESFEKKSLEFQNYCEKRFNLKNTIKSMTQQIEIDIE